MSDESEVIVDVSNLHKYYHGHHILKGIDFQVKTGQLVSIIGRSGCGKTTFLRCLNCLEILDEGRLRVAGVTLSRQRQKKVRKNGLQKRAHQLKKLTGIPFRDDQRALDEDFRLKAHALRKRVGMLFQSFIELPGGFQYGGADFIFRP